MKTPKSFAEYCFTLSHLIILVALTTATVQSMREVADPSIPEEILGAIISAFPLLLYVCYKYWKYKKNFPKNLGRETPDEIEQIQRTLPHLGFLVIGYVAARIFILVKKQARAYLQRSR
jgi:hypothetical protein